MEGIPEYLDYSEILETFLQINGVVRVHNLRIWVSKYFLWVYIKNSANSETTVFYGIFRI